MPWARPGGPPTRPRPTRATSDDCSYGQATPVKARARDVLDSGDCQVEQASSPLHDRLPDSANSSARHTEIHRTVEVTGPTSLT